MAANAGANNCSPTSSAAARQLSRSKIIALVIGRWRWISTNLSHDGKSKRRSKAIERVEWPENSALESGAVLLCGELRIPCSASPTPLKIQFFSKAIVRLQSLLKKVSHLLLELRVISRIVICEFGKH